MELINIISTSFGLTLLFTAIIFTLLSFIEWDNCFKSLYHSTPDTLKTYIRWFILFWAMITFQIILFYHG